MRRAIFYGLGFAFLIWGLVLSLQSFSITGNIIFSELDHTSGSFLGFFFLLLGFVTLFIEHLLEQTESRRKLKTLREVDQMMRSGKIGDYHGLRQIATRLGYELREDAKHTKVFSGQDFVTTIPRGHHGEARTGTYRSILKALRNGYRDEREAA